MMTKDRIPSAGAFACGVILAWLVGCSSPGDDAAEDGSQAPPRVDISIEERITIGET